MAVRKIDRFEVFKRDQFTCQYCGGKPPAITLEIDHIVAKSQGGEDGVENLITACFDCNRGKSARSLGTHLLDKIDTQKAIERSQQLKEYEKFLEKSNKEFEKKVKVCVECFNYNFDLRYNNGTCIAENGDGIRAIKTFLKKLPKIEVIEAIHIAFSKNKMEPLETFKYFCGICHNKIRAQDGNNG